MRCRRSLVLPVLAAPFLQLVFSAAAATQSQEEPSEFSLVPLLPVPTPGWRLDTTFYGGWNSNPLDVPNGPGDYEYSLAASASGALGGRHGAAGLSAAGSYLAYKEIKNFDMLAGAASLVLGRRLSKTSAVAVTGGASYDYSDRLAYLNETAVQLPRTRTLSTYGEATFNTMFGRRTAWSSRLRYDRFSFESDFLFDTESIQASSGLMRRIKRRDSLSLTYIFTTSTAGRVGQEAATPARLDYVIHSGVLGWRHRLSRSISFGLLGGGSSALAPTIGGVRPSARLFIGEATASWTSGQRSLSASFRNSASPGYGFGSLLYVHILNLSVLVPVNSRVALRATGTADRSHDVFVPSILRYSDYLDLDLVGRVTRQTVLAVHYRYRRRDYSALPETRTHEVGLALTGALASGRTTAGRGFVP